MYKLKFNLPSFFRKELFQKKSVRLFFEVIGSLIGLTLLLLLLLLGRLSMGPINLDFLTPEIETTLKAPQAGLSATIEHTQLAWRKWYRPFEIELVDVRLQKDQIPDWIKIEHIGVSLRLYKLFMGEISLKAVRFYHPQILLERDESGKFLMGFGETTPNQEYSFEELAPLLALGGSNPALGKLNELSRISIVDAHVVLKDEKEAITWQFPKTSFTLKRQWDGFQGEITLKPQQGNTSLTLALSHRVGSPRFDFKANFHQICLSELFEKKEVVLCLPGSEVKSPYDFLNFLQCWEVPLNGKVHIALVPTTLEVIGGDCDVDLGKGTLDLSLTKLIPLPISSGNLSFTLSPNEILLETASVLSDEMLIDLSGNLHSPSSPLLLTNLMSSEQTINLEGRVEDLLLDHLGALWPEDLAHHARNWLTTNLRKGIISEATFSLKGQQGEDGFSIDDLRGEIEGENAEITYLKGLPPAQNVKASATFDRKGFDIKILSGEVEAIKVAEGHVHIKDLDTDDESLHLNIKAKGPLSDILDVINHKPLEYTSYASIDPKKTKGAGEFTLQVDFPLLSDLEFKDVKMAGKGLFKKVALERSFTQDINAELRDGEFSLDLTHDQMKVQGKGVLNQLPSTLTYEHFFKKESPYELQIKVETTASFDDFKRLGFDYEEYGKGPTQTTLTYTLDHDKKGHLFIDLDITPATLSVAPLEWVKKPGEKGQISFDLLFEQGDLFKIHNLKVLSPPYSLQGDVFFNSQKKWQTIRLSEFKGPHSQTQVTIQTPSQNVYEVSFKGESVDLETILNYLDKDGNEKNHSPTNVKLFADVDKLRLGEDKIFEHVNASAHLFLQGNEKTWKEVHLRAQAGKGTAYKGDMANVSGGILFDIKPGPHQTQTLEVRANDAGKFLKNLSIYDKIRGGYLTIKAEREGQGPYKGVFKIKQFDAKSVPLLARFAALLSPMGIANLFSEKQTLSMDRFECLFEFGEDLISIKTGIGKSISLGFTTEGKLDRKNRLFSLSGNIIPARFLNSVLSNIPLIGPLLNGGDGEGLFGIAYTVKGSFDEPDVSLNPLSALAPGFIRKLFQSLGTDEE